VATRELSTSEEPVFCAICQRSLLRGEHAVAFLDGYTPRDVCDLCVGRALRLGWTRDGQGISAAPAAQAERARSLVGRLRARREEASTPGQTAPGRPLAAGEATDDLPHHVQAVPTDTQVQATHALALFNASEHSRTVAGVVHSLGAPYVHVGPGEGGLLVEVLVVWELCWYRYEIDLENSVVHLRGQGYEPAELGDELQPANAIADERGKLALARH
jgi:hypothetical protein